jgi:Cu(I)/Ag(I) efflux system membrane protein CusA/SilA
MCIGLFPILWSTGTGADVMKRIAAPMVGGISTSFLLELLVYPAIYAVWRQRSLGREVRPLEAVGTRGVSAGEASQDELVSLRLESSGSL